MRPASGTVQHNGRSEGMDFTFNGNQILLATVYLTSMKKYDTDAVIGVFVTLDEYA